MLPRRCLLLLIATVLACGTTARAAPPAPAPAPLRIDFVAVGQGDAALLTSPAVMKLDVTGFKSTHLTSRRPCAPAKN